MAKSEKRTLSIKASLVDELSSQLSGIKREISRTAEITKKANDKAAKSWGRLKKAAAALAAVYVAIKGVQIARSFAADVDAIGKLAVATGESVENVSELSFAFAAAGGNAGQFRAVLSSILSSQRQAVKATGDQRQAFELLGISVQQLRQARPGEIIKLFADGFEGVGDKSERLRAFATLFPDQWRNVINLIEGGGNEFQKRIEDARKSSATITKEQAKNAAAVNDAFLRVDTAIAAVGRTLLETFGPSLSNGLNAFASALVVNKVAILNIAKLTLVAIRTVIVKGVEAIAFVVEQYEAAVKLFRSVKEGLTFGALDGLDAAQRKRRDVLEDQRLALQAQNETVVDAIRLLKMSGDLSEKQLTTLKRRERQLVLIGERVKENNRLQSLNLSDGPSAAPGIREFAKQLDETIESLFNQEQGVKIRDFFQAAGEGAGEGMAKGLDSKLPLIIEPLEKAGKEGGEKSKSAFVGAWDVGITKLTAQIKDFGNTVGAGLAQITNGGIAAFSNELGNVINRTKDAEEAWDSFLNSSLQLLGKLIAKLATLKLIQTIGGAVTTQFANGGVMPGNMSGNAVPMRSYASGGIARRPQLALFGEGKQAEAFVPLPDNRSIPVTFTGAQGPVGGGAVINLNVYAWDSKDAARGLIENQEVIMGLFRNGAETRNGLRQTIQRAAR